MFTGLHVFVRVARISGLCSVAGPNRILQQKQETHMTNQATQIEPKQAAAKQPALTKGPSKKTQLIKLLSRKSGADTKAISEIFGWQPHSTRAVLSELRKAGFAITKENAGSGRSTRYRIVSTPNTAATVEVTDGK